MELTVNDRFAISDVLSNYCFHLDDHDWEALRRLFDVSAVIDFTALGGPKGNPDEFIVFLQGFAQGVRSWQHTISSNVLEPDPSGVLSRTAAQVMIVTDTEDGSENVAFSGIWYRDLLVREGETWVIKERVLVPSWSHNAPSV